MHNRKRGPLSEMKNGLGMKKAISKKGILYMNFIQDFSKGFMLEYH
jgi:hypothetical protein